MSKVKLLTDITLLKKLSSMVEIVHRSSGRIRLRFDKKIINEIDIEELEKMEYMRFDGIKDVRLNKMAKSITITYDPNIIEDEIWEDLSSGSNLEKVSELFVKLQKDVDAK
ncbi:MAG: HMA2 domain-containing protein [Campylobacterales bacterium]